MAQRLVLIRKILKISLTVFCRSVWYLVSFKFPMLTKHCLYFINVSFYNNPDEEHTYLLKYQV